eukprot:5994714-Pyramimonas_sp.AAC.2
MGTWSGNGEAGFVGGLATASVWRVMKPVPPFSGITQRLGDDEKDETRSQESHVRRYEQFVTSVTSGPLNMQPKSSIVLQFPCIMIIWTADKGSGVPYRERGVAAGAQVYSLRS